MNSIKTLGLILVSIIGATVNGQNISVKSPDNKITVTVSNDKILSYTVTYNGRNIINPSPLGFELKDEPVMKGDFGIIDQSLKNFNETWIPVVKSKHARIENHYNELQLILKEKTGQMRQMDLFVRAYNDGAAFRYKLYRGAKVR